MKNRALQLVLLSVALLCGADVRAQDMEDGEAPRRIRTAAEMPKARRFFPAARSRLSALSTVVSNSAGVCSSSASSFPAASLPPRSGSISTAGFHL